MQILPFQALLKGIVLCFNDKKVRALAMRPWIIGLFFYCATMGGVFYWHGAVVARFVVDPSGFLQWTAYVMVWIIAAALLSVIALVTSFTLVMILGGIFQAAIAQHILALPELALTIREILRSIVTEALKLAWMLPVFVVLFILGFIPLFWPVVFPLTAWLLAYQSVDFALDVLRYSVWQRLGYALRHFFSLTLFGFGLMAFGLIPLAIIFLPPIAAAGGTYLVQKRRASRGAGM